VKIVRDDREVWRFSILFKISEKSGHIFRLSHTT